MECVLLVKPQVSQILKEFSNILWNAKARYYGHTEQNTMNRHFEKPVITINKQYNLFVFLL
jgi:hypothetical protein